MAGRPNGRAKKAAAEAAERAKLDQAPPGTAKRRQKPKRLIPTTQDQRVEEIIAMMLGHQWDGRRSPFELAQAWGCTLNTVTKAAERAGERITTAAGNLERRVTECLGKLDEICDAAMKEKQFSSAVRAVELKLKTAGVFRREPLRKPDEEDRNPQGLPPELARLKPEPSLDEVRHFAVVERPDECTVEGCRIHPKAPPATADQLH